MQTRLNRAKQALADIRSLESPTDPDTEGMRLNYGDYYNCGDYYFARSIVNKYSEFGGGITEIKKKAKEIVEMNKIKHKEAKPDKYLVGNSGSDEFVECDKTDLNWIIQEMIYNGFSEDLSRRKAPGEPVSPVRRLS